MLRLSWPPSDPKRVPLTVELPRLRALLLHAGPNLVEATLMPLLLFYAVMAVGGVWTALAAALAWSWGVLGLRLIHRDRVPGIVLISALVLTCRTVLAAMANSVLLYFVQPAIGTALVGVVFCASAACNRPLVARIVDDLVPLPSALRSSAPVQRYFRGVSVLWGVVHFANAGLTVWLLTRFGIATYLWARTIMSAALVGGGFMISFGWFGWVARRHGIGICRTAHVPATSSVATTADLGLAIAA